MRSSQSATALAIVLGYAAKFGVARQGDEGIAAHLWQLLMVGQMLVAFFAIKMGSTGAEAGAADPRPPV